MPADQHSIIPLFLAVVIVAIVGGIILLLQRFVAGKQATTSPSTASPIGRWSGWPVLLSFVVMIGLPFLLQMTLVESGFFQKLYGADFPLELRPGSTIHADEQASHLRGLWAQTISAPVVVLFMLGVLRFFFQVRPAEAGLTLRHAGADFRFGFMTWLVVAPIVFIIFALAMILLSPHPARHPLMDLGEHAGRLEWALFALQATILWPLVEELAFRSLLLYWQVQIREKASQPNEFYLTPENRVLFCIGAALLLSSQRPETAEAVNAQNWNQLLTSLQPTSFVLLMLPVLYLVQKSKKVTGLLGFSSATTAACFSNALLFAMFHIRIWPTPIPLMVLGLALSWLALRRQRIIASFFLHMTFNAVAVVYSLLA